MTCKVGVMLSGCGVFDGAEIHEAVLTLLFLEKAGAQVVCMAPDVEQFHVINHLTNEQMNEKRNVLVESARIARGAIENVNQVNSDDLDAIILPGGFGAAKNLCNFAVKGPDADMHPDVKQLLVEMAAKKKPIGAICIAPAALTLALADKKPEVTIGNDTGTAFAIEKMGGTHHDCSVDMIHYDQDNNIVTTPAYMLGPGITDVATGIEKLVNKVISLCGT